MKMKTTETVPRMRRRPAGRYLLWALLAIPAAFVVATLLAGDVWPGDLLHPSGEWSARLIIVALMITPLSMLFPGRAWVQWLLRNRRAFGLAAFGYALLHLVLYVLDMETLRNILAEVGALGIWTGWFALLCLLPMAITSNDAAMRMLRANWKRLQRLAYPAALLTLVHWMFVHDGFIPALLNFAPLIALELYRLVRIAGGRGALAT
jgi:methionine sulfoxide reductase heme-binding subunit